MASSLATILELEKWKYSWDPIREQNRRPVKPRRKRFVSQPERFSAQGGAESVIGTHKSGRWIQFCYAIKRIEGDLIGGGWVFGEELGDGRGIEEGKVEKGMK
jgi:hypothetical protein